MRGFVAALFLVPLLALAGVFAAMNLGAEVVTLHTLDVEGREYATSLWIVDDGGTLWLRAERPASRWLERVREHPRVELERGGAPARYRAIPSLGQRAYINRRFAERYGWAERVLARVQNRDAAVPIRLDPLESP